MVHEALEKGSLQWMGNWLPGCTQRIVVNVSNWLSATSWIPLGLIFCLTLFQIFICDTKLSGEEDTSEGGVTLQKDLDVLEDWANKNIMKSNKDKRKALHLGKHNPRVQHKLGSTGLRSSPVKRDLGILVDSKVQMSKSDCCGRESEQYAGLHQGHHQPL